MKDTLETRTAETDSFAVRRLTGTFRTASFGGQALDVTTAPSAEVGVKPETPGL